MVAALAVATSTIWNTVESPAPQTQTPPPTATSTQATTTPRAATSTKPVSYPGEVKLEAYTTAYTYFDNTPPGSSVIAFAKSDGFATLHNVAGGTGTYADPITVAVGHVNENGVDTPDFKPGTRFYLPNLRRYFIVEDTCGDGDTPQLGPCHRLDTPGNEAPVGSDEWLDLWIGGDANSTAAEADACASAITDKHLIIEKPAPYYAVAPGPVFANGACAKQYGDTVVGE